MIAPLETSNLNSDRPVSVSAGAVAEQDRTSEAQRVQAQSVQHRVVQHRMVQERVVQDLGARAVARREALRRTNAMLQRVMQQSDDLVVVFDYCDCHGRVTRRVVSPIRFLDGDRFLGLCLSREAPRQFYRERCRNMKIAAASSFVMPVPICDVM